MRFLFFLFLFISVKVLSQISSSQQKALNNYILYADHSAEEISSVVTSVVEYYPSIQEKKRIRIHSLKIIGVQFNSKEDISITVFNFGKTTASAKNLEKLSKKGRGNYEHITKERGIQID